MEAAGARSAGPRSRAPSRSSSTPSAHITEEEQSKGRLILLLSKAGTDRDTGSVKPGSRFVLGSVSGSENQF